MFEHDFTLIGKHATYTKFLAKERRETDEREKPYIFQRYIDVYMTAAVIGLLHGCRGVRDTTSTDRGRIYADAFATERIQCEFIYRLVMLLDESTGLSLEQRIDRAFRTDSQKDEEKQKSNMELFNSYVLGGIEILYGIFSAGIANKDDFIDKAYEFVANFKEEIQGISNDRIMEALSSYK